VARLNRIRRENPALQQDRTLRFHDVDNPALIAYSKVAGAAPGSGTGPERDRRAPQPAGQGPEDAGRGPADPEDDAGSNIIVCVVNTNAFAIESGNVRLDLQALGIADDSYQLHDLLSGARHFRRGGDLHVHLDPGVMPAQVLRVRRRVRSEQDFEYYL
jgi:starch synthase (maltosyl-transferring)